MSIKEIKAGQGVVIVADDGEDFPLNPGATTIFVHEETRTIVGDSDEKDPSILIQQMQIVSNANGGIKLSIWRKLPSL